jgi:hypothetical protein
MSLTIAEIYSTRFGTKLPLPRIVQDNIARLRIVPVSYKPYRVSHHKHTVKHKHEPRLPDNWRENVLKEYVSKLKDKGDPDYFEMFAILNKLAPSNLSVLLAEALTLFNKRDQQFRLRVATLMFNKAITESMFSVVMAEFVKQLAETIPEIRADIQTQIELFPKLYNIEDTIVYPSSDDPKFDDKVVEWMSQKNKRRGYAKFLTQLFILNLVDTCVMKNGLESVLRDLDELTKKPKTETSEEATTHLVDFIFESSKILPSTQTDLRVLISSRISDILKIPRPDVPSLCMRSRFKLEDALKCVQ